LNKNCQNN